MRVDAGQLGQSETAQAMQTSLDEAKAADEQHNAIARTIMNG